MLAPLVLLLVVPGAEPNEAEKLFREMEAKLTKAKTVECTYEAKIEAPETAPIKSGTAKGAVLLGEGNRFRMEAPFESGKLTFVCDGKKMAIISDDNAQKNPVGEGGREELRVTVARGGGTVFFTGNSPLFSIPFDGRSFEEKLRVSDFKLGQKEMVDKQEAQVIHYHLGKKGTAEVKVWIDTKTHLPLKRVVAEGEGDEKVTFTETYTKLTIDGKIDPKQFELPKK
jgi:outer membrane lipoprotein-sorting protein